MSQYENVFGEMVEDGSDPDPARISETQKYAPERVQAGSEHREPLPAQVTGDRRLHSGSVPITGPTRQEASAPGKPRLMALLGERGQLLVAHQIDGNLVEKFRPATAEEAAALSERGFIIQTGSTAFRGKGPNGLGGLWDRLVPESTLGKVLLASGLLVGGMAAGAYAWDWWQNYSSSPRKNPFSRFKKRAKKKWPRIPTVKLRGVDEDFDDEDEENL